MKEEFPPLDSRAGSPDRVWASDKRNGSPSNESEGTRTPSLRRARSMSFKEPDGRQSDAAERVRYSRAFRTHGFKGNSRGHSIQGPFATLEQTFKALPQHVGFNIELSEEPSLPERHYMRNQLTVPRRVPILTRVGRTGDGFHRHRDECLGRRNPAGGL